MLRLSGCLPNLHTEESHELIHRLLIDGVKRIHDNAKKANKDANTGIDGANVIDSVFPAYLGGTGIPAEKLKELSKMLVSSGEYTPDLEIEYAINNIVEDMKTYDKATMATVGDFYDKAGSEIPDDFYEELWECIFWDNDYTFLDEGHTLETLKGSPVDQQMGITGRLGQRGSMCPQHGCQRESAVNERGVCWRSVRINRTSQRSVQDGDSL